jgi:hypothetical protein
MKKILMKREKHIGHSQQIFLWRGIGETRVL